MAGQVDAGHAGALCECRQNTFPYSAIHAPAVQEHKGSALTQSVGIQCVHYFFTLSGMDMLMAYLLIPLAYLMGSLSTAIITCKLMRLPDPRTLGSNNPGATNVLRYGGRKAAAITLLGDTFKGLIPVLLGKALGLDYTFLILIGIAAFLGHLYPVFYGFKGGKGVATAIGVFLGVSLWGGLTFCAIWLLMAKGFRISSLAALIATALSPLYFWLITGHAGVALGVAFMAVLIFWRHRSNIRNLLDGTEDQIKSREAAAAEED